MKRLIAVCRSRIARNTPRLNRRLARADIWLPQTLPVIALLGGLLLPYILVWKAGIYHLKDYATFAGWADCWLKDSKNIYLNCHPSPNYPFIGVLASAGALSALKTLTGVDDYSEIAKHFHFYLAIFDALNFILLWQLASALKLKHAVWIALLIAALPSSWAGGALWGQIDDVSQFFLLACVLCLVVSIQSADRHQVSSAAYFAGGVLALVALVLTKQLAVFSLPAVAPLVLLACLQLWNSVTKPYGMMVVIATLLLASTLLWFLDSRLEVPPGYYGSSDLFVWLGGGSSRKVNQFSGCSS